MPDVVKHGWTHRPKSQGGTDPIAFPGGGGWPTMHNLLYAVEATDRFENLAAGGSHNWRTFADTTKYGTFKWQNSNAAGTTFYADAVAYFGMMLGPAGSSWGIYLVGDFRTDGGNPTFAWATDEATDGIVSDPTTLTYYDPSFGLDSFSLLSGSPLTDESQMVGGFRINGADGAMLTADATGLDPVMTNVGSSNGGAGFWWLRVTAVTSGSSKNAVVLRDLRVIRLNGVN